MALVPMLSTTSGGWSQPLQGNMPFGGILPQGAEILAPASVAPVTPIGMTNGLSGLKLTGNEDKAGWLGIEGLGKNLDTLRLGLGGLQTIGGLWNAYEQNKLAKRSMVHTQGLLDTNLANNIRAYNLQVEDKFRSRGVMEGHTQSQIDENIERHKARDERKG